MDPKRIHVKLAPNTGSPIRVKTDLSMFAQNNVKKSPDKKKIEEIRKLSVGYVIDKKTLFEFFEDTENN